MKFLTLEHGQLGALLDAVVVDLAAAGQTLGTPLATPSLTQLVQTGDDAAAAAWRLAQEAAAQGIACRDYDAVRPLAPLPQPQRNLICLGKNYLEHAREIARKVDNGIALPTRPIFFTKATTSVIGPGDTIPSYPQLTRKLDYEIELAIILGKGGKGISRQQAMDHVFGYTILNDVSARDLQGDHLQWFLGKSLDGFAPLGPVVAHRSVMPPPADIELRCWINGELRQQATLADLIFDIPTIIETLSAGMTLLAGDIIATGTPAGVGMGFDPARYLRPGDEIVMEVTGVGRLSNPVG
jgi:2-keto-4-pentenoate hydratase/2-oxohepta-3-ene-1,7-dioic acid hydratase in catechol pathway